jgi:hypothetical protein
LSFSLSLILRVSYRLNMMLPCHESWRFSTIFGCLWSSWRVGIYLLLCGESFSGTVTQEMAIATLQALDAVHACGLLIFKIPLA